jgi:hypothetical protein
MVERDHPMLAGFVRLKGRWSRRAGWPIESWGQYLRRRIRDILRYLTLWPRLALEMEEVWLQTRHRSTLEQRVVEELRRIPASVRGWRALRIEELRRAYHRAAHAVREGVTRAHPHPRPSIPPRVCLWLKRWNPFSHSLTYSRQSIDRFWRRCLIQLRRGRLHQLDVSGLTFNALQEASLFAVFAVEFFSRLLVRLFARTVEPMSEG